MTTRLVYRGSALLALAAVGMITAGMGCPMDGNTNMNTNVNQNSNANQNANANVNVNANANGNDNANDNANENLNENTNANANGNENANANDNVAASVLFVVNNDSGEMTSFANPGTLSDEAPPDTRLTGSQTQLFGPRASVVNQAGELLVCNETDNSVTVYADAVAATGDIAPVRRVAGDATRLDSPVVMAIDLAGDHLFVANIQSDGVLVFDNVSTPQFDGDAAPARRFFTPDPLSPLAMLVDSEDNLYITDTFNSPNRSNLFVFEGAGAADGLVTATRTISSLEWGVIRGLFLDAEDRLWVVDNTDKVFRFDGAATLAGTETPNATITVMGPVSPSLTAVAIDSSDIGYFGDRTNNAIYVFENVSTLDGPRAADRTIEGFETRLRGPLHFFLLNP